MWFVCMRSLHDFRQLCLFIWRFWAAISAQIESFLSSHVSFLILSWSTYHLRKCWLPWLFNSWQHLTWHEPLWGHNWHFRLKILVETEVKAVFKEIVCNLKNEKLKAEYWLSRLRAQSSAGSFRVSLQFYVLEFEMAILFVFMMFPNWLFLNVLDERGLLTFVKINERIFATQ